MGYTRVVLWIAGTSVAAGAGGLVAAVVVIAGVGAAAGAAGTYYYNKSKQSKAT